MAEFNTGVVDLVLPPIPAGIGFLVGTVFLVVSSREFGWGGWNNVNAFVSGPLFSLLLVDLSELER